MCRCGEKDEANEDINDAAQAVGLTAPGTSQSHSQDCHEAEMKRLQVGPAHQLGEDHGTAGDVAEQEEEENHDGSNHVGFVWRL